MTLDVNTLDILNKACIYIDKLSEKDGTIFNIGDEDGGYILKLQNLPNSVLDILQFGALILKKQSIYVNKIRAIDYKLLMLFGEKYYTFINENIINTVCIDKGYVFENGGMYVRDGNINDVTYKAMFDFGKIGMEPLNAHAHCDILSFNLNINGNPFLVDSGTYKYHKDEGFRDYFRGVSAHNTISIDEKNQFELLGPFISSKSPLTKLDKLLSDYIQASSECYKKLGCRITRAIFFDNDCISIEDTVVNKSKKNRKIKSFFNMEPKIDCELKENKIICKQNNREIIIEFLSEVKLSLVKGNKKDKIEGWYSKKYYKKVETYTLIIEYEIEKKTEKNIKYSIKI